MKFAFLKGVDAKRSIFVHKTKKRSHHWNTLLLITSH